MIVELGANSTDYDEQMGPTLIFCCCCVKVGNSISFSMRPAVCVEKWVQFPSGGSKEIYIKRESKHTQTIK